MTRLSSSISMAKGFSIKGHENDLLVCLAPRLLIQQVYKQYARNLNYNHSIRSFAEKKHLQFMKK
jgi:hypothetical protein